jgi:hypothetical protein
MRPLKTDSISCSNIAGSLQIQGALTSMFSEEGLLNYLVTSFPFLSFSFSSTPACLASRCLLTDEMAMAVSVWL